MLQVIWASICFINSFMFLYFLSYYCHKKPGHGIKREKLPYPGRSITCFCMSLSYHRLAFPNKTPYVHYLTINSRKNRFIRSSYYNIQKKVKKTNIFFYICSFFYSSGSSPSTKHTVSLLTVIRTWA